MVRLHVDLNQPKGAADKGPCTLRQVWRGGQCRISTSSKTRSAAPSMSSYWLLFNAHRNANRPDKPSPSAMGIRYTRTFMRVAPQLWSLSSGHGAAAGH